MPQYDPIHVIHLVRSSRRRPCTRRTLHVFYPVRSLDCVTPVVTAHTATGRVACTQQMSYRSPNSFPRRSGRFVNDRETCELVTAESMLLTGGRGVLSASVCSDKAGYARVRRQIYGLRACLVCVRIDEKLLVSRPIFLCAMATGVMPGFRVSQNAKPKSRRPLTIGNRTLSITSQLQFSASSGHSTTLLETELRGSSYLDYASTIEMDSLDIWRTGIVLCGGNSLAFLALFHADGRSVKR